MKQKFLALLLSAAMIFTLPQAVMGAPFAGQGSEAVESQTELDQPEKPEESDPDIYCPVYIDDETRVYEGEPGDRLQLRPTITENPNNNSDDENGYVVDLTRAAYQWYQLAQDTYYQIPNATNAYLDVTVDENMKTLYLEVTVPVTKGTGEDKQTFWFRASSDPIYVQTYDLLRFENDENTTIYNCMGAKQTISANCVPTEYANNLLKDGYEETITYQWYEQKWDENDELYVEEDIPDAVENAYTVTIQDEERVYFCKVTCTLEKEDRVYTKTQSSPYYSIRVENAFDVLTTEGETDQDELSVSALPGCSLKMQPIISKTMKESTTPDQPVPKYRVGDFTYVWEKGSLQKDEASEEVVTVWKKISGATLGSYTAKVLKHADEEYYRCTVSAIINEGTENAYTESHYVTYYVVPLPNPISITIKTDPTYYCYYDKVKVQTQLSFPPDDEEETEETEKTVEGYLFSLNGDIRYQWEEMKEEQGEITWEPISGATKDTLLTVVDGKPLRVRITGAAWKDGNPYEYSYVSEAIRLHENVPIWGRVVSYKGNEKIVGEDLYLPYGSQAVLEAEVEYDQEVVSDLTVTSYQWSVWDEKIDDYIELKGETKKSLSVKIEKPAEYDCAIHVKAKIDGVEKEKNMDVHMNTYVDNLLRTSVIAKDASGKTVSAETKGEITLYALIIGNDTTDVKVQWMGCNDPDIEDYSEIPGATDTTYTVDMTNAFQHYKVLVTDRFGNEMYKEFHLPIEDSEMLSTREREKISNRLSVGKTLVRVSESDDETDKDRLGSMYAFTPEKDGIYRIWSGAAKIPVGPLENSKLEYVDPNVTIYDADGIYVAYYDDFGGGRGYFNFDFAFWGKKGVTYYFVFGREGDEYYVNVESSAINHVHIYDKKSGDCILCGENKNPKQVSQDTKQDSGKNAGTEPVKNDNTDAVTKTIGEPVGTTLTVRGSKVQYIVTKQGDSKNSPEVKYTVPKKLQGKKKTLKVPAAITASGVTYQVTTLDKKAFAYEKKAVTIDLGKNVKTIRAKAFKGCKKLKVLMLRNMQKPVKLTQKTFAGTKGKITVRVPKQLLGKYKKQIKKQKLTKKVILKTL